MSGAWIVTGGTNLGVMKHVGEAVRDYGLTSANSSPIVAIGIATWGCVQKKDELISVDVGHCNYGNLYLNLYISDILLTRKSWLPW